MRRSANKNEEESYLHRLCRESEDELRSSGPPERERQRVSLLDIEEIQFDLESEVGELDDFAWAERANKAKRDCYEPGSSLLSDAPDASTLDIPADASSAEKLSIVRDAWLEAVRYDRDIVEAAFECSAKLTDRILTNLVIGMLGDDLRWLASHRTWLVWTGKVWERSDDETVTGKVLGVAEWLAAGAFFEHLRWRYIDALGHWAEDEDLGEVRVVEKAADPDAPDWEPSLPEKVVGRTERRSVPVDEVLVVAAPNISNIDLWELVGEQLGNWGMPRNPQGAKIKGEKLSSRRVITDVIALAKTQVPVSADELDRHPDLLCVENGVVDLRTGDLRPHVKEEMLTQMIELEFDPEASCPTWMRCLSDWQPAEFHPFIQRVAGHFLSGWTHFERFYVFQGPANSGKSTFLNTIRKMMGAYSRSANPRLVSKLDEGIVRDDLAGLQGKRLAHISEWSPRGDVDACVIKRIVTSENDVTAAFKHRNEFQFRPEFTIAIDTNSRPPIKDQSDGVWRRMVLIPFSNVIQDVRPGEIESALRDEREGILAWAIEGAVQLHRRGLEIPTEISAEIDEYRSLTDPFQSFLEWAVVESEGGAIHADLLFNAYKWFCRDAEAAPFSKQAFYSALKERGLERKRRNLLGKKPWCILGVAWHPDVPAFAKNGQRDEGGRADEVEFSLDE